MSRVVLIGPGAIGAAVAGALLANGHEVAIAARTPFGELRVEHPDGEVLAPAWCVDEPDDALDPDAVVVAVKAHQTPGAAAWVSAAAAGGAPVYVLQNGVEQEATVRPFVGAEAPVFPVVVNLPAHRKAPGHAVVTGRANLTVPAADREVLGGLLDGSFVRLKAVDDWLSPAWIKLMMNAAMGGIGALTQRDNRVFSDPEARVLCESLMEEVAAVGRAEGARIPAELPAQMVDRVQRAAGGHASSIVVDRRNANPTEWEVRNAAVGRIGRRHGIPTPLNDLITTLIRLGEPED